MPLVWKEIIPGPGTYWYKDQDTGTPRTIDFDPPGIQHFHDTGKAMLAAGLAVPVPLEHPPPGNPLALPLSAYDQAALRARHNTGATKDYRLTPRGGLEAQLDVQDRDVAEKLGKSLLWTSPYISSFTDGNGRQWDNVICHNAITTRPRITDQQPFPSVAAALSLVPQLPHETFDPKTPLRTGLSLVPAGRLVPTGGGAPGLRPAQPVAFSLLSGARLAVAEMKKPEKKKPPEGKAAPRPGSTEGDRDQNGIPDAVEDKNKDGVPDGETDKDRDGILDSEQELGPDGMPLPESKVDADGDIPVWEVIRDLLEHEGLTLPEGTGHDNFYENLYTCLMDKLKADVLPEAPMTDPTKPPQAGIPPGAAPTRPPNVVQEQPPLYMSQLSLADVEGIQDPRMKQMARVALSLQERALNDAKKARMDKIDALLRRAPLHRREALKALFLKQLAGAQLSLSAEGAVKDEASEWLSAFSTLIDEMPNMPDLLGNKPGQYAEQPHPQEYQGEMSEERRQQVVAELMRNVRIPALPDESKAG